MKIKRINVSDAMFALVIVCVISWSMDYGFKDEPKRLGAESAAMISQLDRTDADSVTEEVTDVVGSVK